MRVRLRLRLSVASPLLASLLPWEREVFGSFGCLCSFARDSWWAMDGGDFLGEQQWNWLKAVLRASAADVHVVVSSLQVLASHR